MLLYPIEQACDTDPLPKHWHLQTLQLIDTRHTSHNRLPLEMPGASRRAALKSSIVRLHSLRSLLCKEIYLIICLRRALLSVRIHKCAVVSRGAALLPGPVIVPE